MKKAVAANLICAPEGWPGAVGTVKGYKCAKCSKALQVAPSSLLLMRQRPITCICMSCFVEEARKAVRRGEAVEVEPPNAEQLSEFAAARRKARSN